tara:strand:+ start:416 stop:1054 length:639 start_codon:yes stop_codon:yes gene_type:complete
MEEKWWNSEETDHAAADDSGSDMNDEPLRPLPDKNFTTGSNSVLSVIVVSFVLGLPAIIFGGAGVALMAFSIMNPNHEDAGLATIVCFGIPCLLVGLLCILILLSALSKKRLRVQHSVDRLVFESTFLGRVNYSKERPLSEAEYLEYKKTVYQGQDADGNSTTSTRRTYTVHGHSSEEGEWEIRIEDLILKSGDHPRKAREIADAIGIEFRR